MQKLKRTAAKRKLLPKSVLHNAYLRYSYGSSIQRIINSLSLDMSSTALNKLILRYGEYVGAKDEKNKLIIYDSLFPRFLDKSKLRVQTNPDNWYYVGYFPYGKWEQE